MELYSDSRPDNISQPPGMPQPDAAAPPPGPRPWGAWATIGLGVVIFLINSAAQVLVLIAFMVANLVSSPDLDLPMFTEGLSINGLFFATATVISAAAGTGFIILFIAIRKGNNILDYLGLRSFPWKRILVFLGVFLVLIGFSSAFSSFIETGEDAGFAIETYRTSVWPVLFWIAAVVFAPVFEECFFRGFLFTGLRSSAIGVIGTIVLTALVWAVLHIQYSIYGMATILVLGIFLGIVRWKTNSLWGPLIIHAGWNLLALVGAAQLVDGS